MNPERIPIEREAAVIELHPQYREYQRWQEQRRQRRRGTVIGWIVGAGILVTLVTVGWLATPK